MLGDGIVSQLHRGKARDRGPAGALLRSAPAFKFAVPKPDSNSQYYRLRHNTYTDRVLWSSK